MDWQAAAVQERRLRIRAENALESALADVAERENALLAAEELAGLGSWVWEPGSSDVTWSDQVHRIFGTDPRLSPSFSLFASMVVVEDRERVLAVLAEAAETGLSFVVDYHIVRADGEIREMRSRGRAEVAPDGRPVRLIGGVQDVTERIAAARELRESRDLFAGVLDAATEQSIIATDPDGIITVFNSGAERMLGYTAAEMVGTSPERLHDAGEIRTRAAELGIEAGFGVFLAEAAAGRPETRQWTYVTRTGERLQASITVTAMRGPAGAVSGFIKVGTDITARLNAEAALRDSERRFRDTFQYAPHGMLLLGMGRDNTGLLLQVNPALCRLTGYSEAELLQMDLRDLVAPEDRDSHAGAIAAFQDDPGVTLGSERHWVHADGHDLWVQISTSPTPADSVQPHVVCQVEDITVRKQVEAKLRYQAMHDGLTGLPNRMLLMDRIEHALSITLRSPSHVAVLYIDLDGFKAINDTAGHAAGDQALVQVAKQIGAVLRPSDTVARLGGDEFVVVCEGIETPEMAVDIADRVLAAVRQPFQLCSGMFAVSASIGIGVSRPGTTAEQLLHEADHAMYGAKRDGKARHRMGGVDDPAELAQSVQAMRAMRIEGELREALDRDELVLFGQPVYDVTTGVVVAVESLLRWRHPTRGLLAPGEFLDVAEAGDLMLPIGRRALQESCRMAADWLALLGTAAPAVHVNVSGRQLEFGSLTSDVRQALARYELPPSQLVLELTETHTPLITDALRQDLVDLRTFGVRVAIDDLGTGYSSLTRITELPVDILKIDLRFVAGMATDPACAAVVHGILAIGSSLGLDVIAEGVETAGQARQLGEYGCTLDQGYLYSRPLAETDLTAHLLRNRQADPTGQGAARSAEARAARSAHDRTTTTDLARLDAAASSMTAPTGTAGAPPVTSPPATAPAPVVPTGAAPSTSPEALRSRSARQYVMGGPLIARLETLLTLVSQTVDFPIVRVNIVDEDTQHTVSLFGAGDPAAVARADAFCDLVVRTGCPLLVEDATEDPRFAGLRPVASGEIGAYLGVPLMGRESMTIGAVCVIDPDSRTIAPGQLKRLTEFARVVEDQLDLIRRLQEHRLESALATDEIALASRR